MGINHRTTNRSKAIYTEGEIENTFNMQRFLIFMTSLACTLSAPQFLSDKANDAGNNCHSEIETVFEDTEEEAVSKVICETEFRDSCETRLEPVCRNVTIGTEKCDILPHEECRQVLELVPKRISKKVTKVVCQEERQMDEMKKEPNNEADEGVPDINDILEIFGITNIDYENEIEIDDGLRSSSTTTTTTTTSDTREFLPTSSTQNTMREMDGSKIIFLRRRNQQQKQGA